MRRRHVDGKLKRPPPIVKLQKLRDEEREKKPTSKELGWLYARYLSAWLCIVTVDYIMEVRLEFAWPFILLLRSVKDTYTYKGLTFSLLFLSIALMSDMISLFFVPAHLLFFVASSMVWLQYVWHTDMGMCTPTVLLWMLLVYLEAVIRWRDQRHTPWVDLCRPFAAHCIGYPVVTLGFGCKTYITYRFRLRRQRFVAVENESYMQLLQQALPTRDEPSEAPAPADGTLSAAVGGAEPTAAVNVSVADGFPTNIETSPANNNSSMSGGCDGGDAVSFAPPTDTPQQHHSQRSNHMRPIFWGNCGAAASAALAALSAVAPTALSVWTMRISEQGNVSFGDVKNSSQANTNSKQPNGRPPNPDVASTPSSKSSSRDRECDKGGGRSGSANGGGYGPTPAVVNVPVDADTTAEMSCDDRVDTSTEEPVPIVMKVNGKKGRRNKKIPPTPARTAATQTPPLPSPPQPMAAAGAGKSRPLATTPARDMQALQPQPQQLPSNRSTASNSPKAISPKPAKPLQVDASTSTPATPPPPPCEQCARNAIEMKRHRSEAGHIKQLENEVRQKAEACATAKANAQAKLRDCEELDKKVQRLQESLKAAQTERQALHQSERRLIEERRKRSALDSQLQAEQKQRRTIEERAAKVEPCGDTCKNQRQQLEADCEQLRHDLADAEESKKSAEQQSRDFEQELRLFEAELRTREPRERFDLLMSAMTSMQEKTSTLEKQLSAETRIKLDLFSALGEAKRELELESSECDSKRQEILHLKAQLVEMMTNMSPVSHHHQQQQQSMCGGDANCSSSSLDGLAAGSHVAAAMASVTSGAGSLAGASTSMQLQQQQQLLASNLSQCAATSPTPSSISMSSMRSVAGSSVGGSLNSSSTVADNLTLYDYYAPMLPPATIVNSAVILPHLAHLQQQQQQAHQQHLLQDPQQTHAQMMAAASAAAAHQMRYPMQQQQPPPLQQLLQQQQRHHPMQGRQHQQQHRSYQHMSQQQQQQQPLDPNASIYTPSASNGKPHTNGMMDAQH